MATETIPFLCVVCGKHTMGLEMAKTPGYDGLYQRIWCCNCHHFSCVKVPA